MQYRKSAAVFFISLILCLQAIPTLATESESSDHMSSRNEQKQENGLFQTVSNFWKKHGDTIVVGTITTVACAIFIAALGGEPQQSSYNLPTKTGGGGYDQPYIPAGNKNGGQYVHVE